MNSYRAFVTSTLLLGALVCATPARADWAQFGGPGRDCVSSETGLLHKWPDSGPRELWSLPVGQGYASPAIKDGEVYILDRKDDQTDILRCLSFKDGKELWNYSYDVPGTVGHTGSRCAPTVDDKYVYCVGLMGNFLCVDRKTHKPVWEKNLMSDYKSELPQWGYSQSPLLYKNLVIVAAQAKDAFAVAYNRETGEVAWKSPGLGLAGYVSPMVTTLAGVEQLVVLSASNKGATELGATAGLSLTDGTVLWKYVGWQCVIPIPNPTPIGDDKLFITGGYDTGSAIIQIAKGDAGLVANEVVRLDAKTCGSQIQQPILHKGYLYVLNNSNERELGMSCFALDGTLKWRTSDTEGLPKFERGPFMYADGMFIILDGKSGVLYLVEPSPEGYKELAHAKVLEGKELWAPLALTEGKLLIRSQDVLKCLDLKNP